MTTKRVGIALMVGLTGVLATTWFRWFSWYTGGDSTFYATAWNEPYMTPTVPRFVIAALMVAGIDLVFEMFRGRPSGVLALLTFLASLVLLFEMLLAYFPAAAIDQYDKLPAARLALLLVFWGSLFAAIRLLLTWRARRSLPNISPSIDPLKSNIVQY